MSSWWKTTSGTYVNGSVVGELVPVSVSGTWRVSVGSSGPRLVGDYADQAAAEEGIRVLTQGIDPGTITGA